MSTIEDSDVVDWIATDPGRDRIVLAIADRLDWEDEQGHLSLLQAKINCYLEFVENGDVYKRSREITDRRYGQTATIVVEAYGLHPMSPYAQKCFEHAKAVFAKSGIDLMAKVGER